MKLDIWVDDVSWQNLNLVWLSVHMIVSVQIMISAIFTMYLLLEHWLGNQAKNIDYESTATFLQRHRAIFDFDVHFAWISVKFGGSWHDLVVVLHTESLTGAVQSLVSEVTTASRPSRIKFICLYYILWTWSVLLLSFIISMILHHQRECTLKTVC